MKMRTSVVPVEPTTVASTSTALVHKPGVEDIIAVVDISASMGTDFRVKNHEPISRMGAVVEALHYIIDSSNRTLTRIGLIAFDDHAELLQQKTDRFTNVKAAAMKLEPRGSTYMSRGMELALEAEPHRIILLSDGETSDRATCVQIAYEAAARHVKIDTVGIGDTGLDLLREIARITGGVFMFADSLDALRESFMKLETRARLQLEHKT